MSDQRSRPGARKPLQDQDPAFAGQIMPTSRDVIIHLVHPMQHSAADHNRYGSNSNDAGGDFMKFDSQAQYVSPILGVTPFPRSPFLNSSRQMQQPAPEWSPQDLQGSAVPMHWMAHPSRLVQDEETPAQRALWLSSEQFHPHGHAQSQWSTPMNPDMQEAGQYAEFGDVIQGINGQFPPVAPGYVYPANINQVHEAFDKLADEVEQNGFPLHTTSQDLMRKRKHDGVVNVPQQVKGVRLDPSVALPSPSTHAGHTTAPPPRAQTGFSRKFTGSNEQFLDATSSHNPRSPSTMILEHTANISLPPQPEFVPPHSVDQQPPTITLSGPGHRLLNPEMSLRETSRDISDGNPAWVASQTARTGESSRSPGQNPEMDQGNQDRSSSSSGDNAEASFHTPTAGSHLDPGNALGQETGDVAGNNDDDDDMNSMFDFSKYNSDLEAGQLNFSQPTASDEFQLHPLPDDRGDKSFTNARAVLEHDHGKEADNTREDPTANAEAEAKDPEAVPQVYHTDADNFPEFDGISFQEYLEHGHKFNFPTDLNQSTSSRRDTLGPSATVGSPFLPTSAAFQADEVLDPRLETEQDRRNDYFLSEGYAAPQPTQIVADSTEWANGTTMNDWIGTGDYDETDPEAFARAIERKNAPEAAGYNEQRERNQWGLPPEYACPTVPVTATAVAKVDPVLLNGTDPGTIDWARYENGRDKQEHLQLITLCSNYISNALRVSLPALRSKAKSAIEGIVEVFARVNPAIDKVMFTSLCLEGEVFPEWHSLLGEKSGELTQEGGEVSFCQSLNSDALDAEKRPEELSLWKQELGKWISEWDVENKRWKSDPPTDFQKEFNVLWKNLDSLLELVYSRREVTKELISEIKATKLGEPAKPEDLWLWHSRCYLMWVYLHDGVNPANPFNYVCINDTVEDLKTIMGYEIAAWRELLKDITAVEERITAAKDQFGKVPHLKRIGFQTAQRQELLAQKDETAHRLGLVECTPPASPTQNQVPMVPEDAEASVSNKRLQDESTEQVTRGGFGNDSEEPFDPVTLDDHRAQQGASISANQTVHEGRLPPWKLEKAHASDKEYRTFVKDRAMKLLNQKVEESSRRGRPIGGGTQDWQIMVKAAKEEAHSYYVTSLAMKMVRHERDRQSNARGVGEAALKKHLYPIASQMASLQQQRIQKLNDEQANFVSQHGEQAWNWQQERRVYERLSSEINGNTVTPKRQHAGGDNAAATTGHGTHSERRRASQVEENRELRDFYNRRLAQLKTEWLDSNPGVVPGPNVQGNMEIRATVLARRDQVKKKKVQGTESAYRQHLANKGQPLTRERERDILRRAHLEGEMLEFVWKYEDQASQEMKTWCQTNNVDPNSTIAQERAAKVKAKFQLVFTCVKAARHHLESLLSAAEKRGELITPALKRKYEQEAAKTQQEVAGLYHSEVVPAMQRDKVQYKLAHPELGDEDLNKVLDSIELSANQRLLTLYHQQLSQRSAQESVSSHVAQDAHHNANQVPDHQTYAHDADHRSPNVVSQAQFPSFDGSSSPPPRVMGLDGKLGQPAAPRQRKKSTTTSRKNSKDSGEMAPPPVPKKAAAVTKEKGKATNQSSPTAGKRLPTQTQEPTHINLVTPSPEPEDLASQQTPQLSAGTTRATTARKIPMEMSAQVLPGSQQIPTLGQAASRQYAVPQAGMNYAPPEYYTSTPAASRSFAMPSCVAPQAPMMPMMTGGFDKNPGHVPRQNGENNNLQSYQAALRKEVNSQPNATANQQGHAQSATNMSPPKARTPNSQQSSPRQAHPQKVSQASPSQADANVFRPSPDVFRMAQHLPFNPQQSSSHPDSPQRTPGQAQSPRTQGLAGSPGRAPSHHNSPRQTQMQHSSPRQAQVPHGSPQQTQAQASSLPRSSRTANAPQAQSMLPPSGQLMTPNGTHVSAANREFAEAVHDRYQAPSVNDQTGQVHLQSASQSSPAMTPGDNHMNGASKAFASAITKRPGVVLPSQIPQKTEPGSTLSQEQTQAVAPTVSETSAQSSLRPSIQLDPSARSSQASATPLTQPAAPAHGHLSQGLKRKASDQPMSQHQAAKKAKHTQQSWAALMARQKHAHTIPDWAWNAAQVSKSRNSTPSPNQSFTRPVNDEVMIPDLGALPAMNAFDNAINPENDLGFPPEPQGTRFDGAHGIAHNQAGARPGVRYFGEEHSYGKVMAHKKMNEMQEIERKAFNPRAYELLQQAEQRRKSSTVGYGYAFVGSQDLPGEIMVRVPRMPGVNAQETGSNVMQVE